MSLKTKAVSGLAWSGGVRIATFALQFVLNVTLARLLMPKEFGLVAMITVFSGFMVYFVDSGMGAALVNVPELEERHRSSVFWVQLAAGVLLCVLLSAAAPLIAALYDEPRLVMLTRLMSLDFVLVSLVLVHTWLLNRDLRFRRVTLIELAAEFLSGALAITGAFMGYGAIAIITGLLSYSGFRALFLWFMSGWRPRFMIERRAIREVFAFGRDMTVHTFLNYWVRRGDDLLIGKFVGPEGLGIYSRAYMVMLMPLIQVTRVVARVMFPVLSRIRDDDERIRRIYLRALGAIALVTFPMTLGLLAVAELFVLALLGTKWAAMIPVLQLFCVAGLVQSVDLTGATLLMAKGRTDLLVRWKIVSSTFTLAAFVAGLPWGVLGVATAFTLRTFVLGYFNFSIPGRVVALPMREVFRTLAGPLVASAAMSAAVYAVSLVLPSAWPELARLIGLVALGAVCYAGFVWGTRLRAFTDVKELLQEHFRKRRLVATPGDTSDGSLERPVA